MATERTSYDNIYQVFITNCNTVNLMMPSNVKQQYNIIRNAVTLYNNRMKNNIECDDETEMVDRLLTNEEILIIAHYIRLTVLTNTRTYKNSIFTTFTQEIGVRNINSQLNSLKDEIKEENKTIDMLIFNMSDPNVM